MSVKGEEVEGNRRVRERLKRGREGESEGKLEWRTGGEWRTVMLSGTAVELRLMMISPEKEAQSLMESGGPAMSPPISRLPMVKEPKRVGLQSEVVFRPRG